MERLGLNFGLVIAYLIPGLLMVYAIADFSPPIDALIGGTDYTPSVGAIIPLLIISLAAGSIANALSWAFVRPVIALTGVRRPEGLDYKKLRTEDLELHRTIVEENFRYHQFYANMLVALATLSPEWVNWPPWNNLARCISFLIVFLVMFMAARDSLKRAFTRLDSLNVDGGKDD